MNGPDSDFSGPTAPTRTPTAAREAEDRRLRLQRDAARDRARVVRWAALGIAVAAVALAWFFRWDVRPVVRDGPIAAYAVDRIFGTVYFVVGTRARPVTKEGFQPIDSPRNE